MDVVLTTGVEGATPQLTYRHGILPAGPRVPYRMYLWIHSELPAYGSAFVRPDSNKYVQNCKCAGVDAMEMSKHILWGAARGGRWRRAATPFKWPGGHVTDRQTDQDRQARLLRPEAISAASPVTYQR